MHADGFADNLRWTKCKWPYQKFDDPLDKDIHTDSEDSDDEGMQNSPRRPWNDGLTCFICL